MAVDQTLISYILNPWDGSYQSGTTLIELSYSNLDFTPSTSDSYKSTSGDIFKVYVNGVRIYRSSDASYVSGYGFLESGDIDNSTLNGISGVSWNDTSDSVWTIDTANELILVNTAAILSTTLYGPSNLDLSFVSGTTVIQIDRVVQDQRTPAVDFSNASILTEQDLDSNSKNVFHIAQEAIDFASRTIRTDAFGAFDAQGQDLTNVSQLIVQNDPTLDKNVVTKTYLEDTWLSPADKTNAATVQTLSSEIASIGNNPYKADVETVADATYKAQVQTVADATYKGNIETVANATYKAQVETLADATYKADIETVANSAYVADIQDVANDLQAQVSEIKTVADDLQTGTGFSEIKTVADDLQLDTTSKIKTVSDDLQGTNTIGTLANATYKAQVEAVADATYKTKVEAVATDLLGDNNIGTVVTNIANVNAVAAGIEDVNRYADEYTISATEPTSPSEGDLWYDSTNNALKVRTATAWAVIEAVPQPLATTDSPTFAGITAGTADINGGTIDGTTIGGNTPAAGSFTDMKFDSGYGSVATAYGCRAWVNFDGTASMAIGSSYGPDAPPADFSTPNPIRGSGNVSSITDNSTGRYTVNFTTAIEDANYSVVCSCGGYNDSVNSNLSGTPSVTTSSVIITTVEPGVNNRDSSYVTVAIFR